MPDIFGCNRVVAAAEINLCVIGLVEFQSIIARAGSDAVVFTVRCVVVNPLLETVDLNDIVAGARIDRHIVVFVAAVNGIVAIAGLDGDIRSGVRNVIGSAVRSDGDVVGVAFDSGIVCADIQTNIAVDIADVIDIAVGGNGRACRRHVEPLFVEVDELDFFRGSIFDDKRIVLIADDQIVAADRNCIFPGVVSVIAQPSVDANSIVLVIADYGVVGFSDVDDLSRAFERDGRIAAETNHHIILVVDERIIDINRVADDGVEPIVSDADENIPRHYVFEEDRTVADLENRIGAGN